MKYKKDDRAARGLWAPGKYLNRCDTCRELFVGAKLCMRCADCAYAPSPQDTVECECCRLNSSDEIDSVDETVEQQTLPSVGS